MTRDVPELATATKRPPFVSPQATLFQLLSAALTWLVQLLALGVDRMTRLFVPELPTAT